MRIRVLTIYLAFFNEATEWTVMWSCARHDHKDAEPFAIAVSILIVGEKCEAR
jgi:hypothetical protein